MSSEKYIVSGKYLVEKVKQLVHAGNVRRVCLIHKGKTLIDMPLTVGAPAAAAAVLASPVLAAAATVAAMVTECTIEVEKEKEAGRGKT